jgi:outer membrane protein assembly factor BamB
LLRPVFLSLVFVTFALSVLGHDWPQFRGPTGQGLAEGKLPSEWSAVRNVAWKQPIPGNGWSSPIVWQGRIYLTTAVPLTGTAAGDQSLQALCLDADTGKILWKKEVFKQLGAAAPRIHTKNSHASPTPVTDGERLYVHFGHQGTACLDVDGKVLWKNNNLRYQPVHGNGGSPILVDRLLVFSADGSDKQFLAALDCKNGKVAWKTERKTELFKKFSFGTPLLIEVEGKKQIVSPGSGMVAAYDPKDGKEIWRVRYDGYSVVPRPVFGHGMVFVCTGYERPELLAIRPDGKGDVTDSHLAWTARRNVPHSASPVQAEEELYMVSDLGVASCLDAKTGQVHWQERVGGNYSASPLFADGKVYFQSEEGDGIVVKAGKSFERLARNSLDERTLASYAVVDNALLIRTEKHLFRIEER